MLSAAQGARDLPKFLPIISYLRDKRFPLQEKRARSLSFADCALVAIWPQQAAVGTVPDEMC